MIVRLILLALLVAPALFAQTVTELPSPAAAGSGEPFLFATARAEVLMSWLEPAAEKKTSLRMARLTNGKWSAPMTVATRGDFFVNWADFPSVVQGADGTLFAHWLQKSGAGTYAYDVRLARSRDGKTWSESVILHRDGKQAEHGFVSLAPYGKGVAAVWLDGREMKEGSHGGEHEGSMTLRYATVAADGTIANEKLLDARVCECCTTGMAVGAEGPIVVYRDRSETEVRDIGYVRAAKGAWTKPRLVHPDGWKIAGCPVNGPQIDARGRTAVTAWFTAAENKGKVHVAFSADAGATFGKAVRIDRGAPVGRADVVLLDDGSAFAVWIDGIGTAAEIISRRIAPNGTLGPIVRIGATSAARAAGFPRIARVGNAVYVAWTEAAATKRVRVARVNR